MSKSLFEHTSWEKIKLTKFKLTKIKLEFLSDPNMYIFFENGMRGGVSYISNRYSKANNKYLKSYEPQQESKHIYILRREEFIWLCNV